MSISSGTGSKQKDFLSLPSIVILLTGFDRYPNGNWPGIATDITGNNNKSGSDDFGLKSVSFWRFKNIKLSYDLPRNWLQHNKLGQGAQVYVDLQNTLLLSNYEGLDPEMEQNAAPFPIPFTMVVGVNITF